MRFKDKVFRHLSNLYGWRTNRKIVVFESDDWGSIRIPNKEIKEKFIKAGVNLNANHFTKYDSLESNEDLESLYEVLLKHSDIHGNHPVYTALFIPANPDFDKIELNGFERYFCENSLETLKNYPNREKVNELWDFGLRQKIFFPQLHGREHLNVRYWIDNLKADFPVTLKSFYSKFTGIPPDISNENRSDYQAAFEPKSIEDLKYMKTVLPDAVRHFEQIFRFKPKYFVAPNGPFSIQLEEELFKLGISYLGTPKIFKDYIGKTKPKTRFRYQGQLNNNNQIFICRNARFEPSRKVKFDWVKSCIEDIKIAFTMKKPAIISTHRVNYIGSINRYNREKNLILLDNLLKEIQNRWPDVEFMNSVQLGKTIRDKKNA